MINSPLKIKLYIINLLQKSRPVENFLHTLNNSDLFDQVETKAPLFIKKKKKRKSFWTQNKLSFE